MYGKTIRRNLDFKIKSVTYRPHISKVTQLKIIFTKIVNEITLDRNLSTKAF